MMTTTDELLARQVNLESEVVQARQRKNPAEQVLGSSPTTYPAVILGKAVHPPRQLESSTRALLASRSRSQVRRQSIHVQSIRVCGASEDERCLRLGDTERRGSCGEQ